MKYIYDCRFVNEEALSKVLYLCVKDLQDNRTKQVKVIDK